MPDNKPVQMINLRHHVEGVNYQCAHPGCYIWTPHIHAESTVSFKDMGIIGAHACAFSNGICKGCLTEVRRG